MAHRPHSRLLTAAASIVVALLATVQPAPVRADPGLVHVPIDAASVDGFEASLAPTAGKLLALNGQGSFPYSVIPGCGLGQVLKFSAVGWGCAADDSSPAVYSAGPGLQLSGSTFSVSPSGVQSSMLADGSVTGAKIADGGVGVFDLAFDPATQGELDSHKGSTDHDSRYFTQAQLSTAGTINTPANPMDWTKLKGVPAGLADGVDDVSSGPATDVVCTGCVGTADLGDGQVTGAKILDATVGTADLGFDPATQAELNALAAAGIINVLANPVDWTKLKGVPAGLADGVDADSGGDVTGVGTAAGSGLTGGAAAGDANLGLITTCAAGQLLKFGVGGWACAADVDTNSGGDITGVSAGPGLSGGATTGDAALSANLTPPGGDAGAAVTVARGDHAHDARYFTQAQLSTPGVLNDARNPVDWTRLKQMPPGFADGVDDVSTGPATDVVCAGCVDGSDLADKTITGANILGGEIGIGHLAFDPATQSELDSLAAAGTINTATNPMEWTKLKSVPASLADGVDGGLERPVFARTALDTSGVTGLHTSVTVGADGFPFVTYHDGTNADLKAVHCTSVSCATRDAPLALDTAGNAGEYTSVAVGADGFPFVTYRANADLKAVHCTSVSCATRDAPRTLDSFADLGHYTSVTVGTDGFPFVTYLDATNADLKAVHCTSVSCATQDAPVALDIGGPFGNVGKYTSVTVGTDGFPFVTYQNYSDGNIMAVHCTSVSCATRDAPVVVRNTSGGASQYTSVTVGADGFPFVTFRVGGEPGAVHCTSVSCATRDAPLGLDGSFNAGQYTSVTVGADGFPFVTYHDGTNADLKAVHCTSVSCATRDAPLALDTAGFVGQHTSVTVGADGFPFLTYFDATNGDLKAVHCSSHSCVPFQRRR